VDMNLRYSLKHYLISFRKKEHIVIVIASSLLRKLLFEIYS